MVVREVDEPGLQIFDLDNGALDEIVQATLKDVTGETRQTFLEAGTQSFISVPIMLRAGLWGFLGLDDCRAERVWNTLEIDVLKTAAALIAGAMERVLTLVDGQLVESGESVKA